MRSGRISALVAAHTCSLAAGVAGKRRSCPTRSTIEEEASWDIEKMPFAAAAATALLMVQSPAAQADGWIGSWGASDVFPVGPDVNFQTLRQFVRLSAGGKQLRVRFSNATGQYPLVIGAAHIAKPAADSAPGAIDPATDHALTFGGGPAASPWRPERRWSPIRSRWNCRRCRPWRSACSFPAGRALR